MKISVDGCIQLNDGIWNIPAIKAPDSMVEDPALV
jgi:hypothetical protein